MADTTDSKEKSEEAVLAEIQSKITEAFDLFDHESNKTVDIREVGTIIRSLGCYPSEAEIQEILAEVEDEPPSGSVQFEKFLPVMTTILREKRFQPASYDEIVKAFRVLDVERKGYLLRDEMTKFMTDEGEPFTEEELDEMMSQAIDPEKGYIPYLAYANIMAPEDD